MTCNQHYLLQHISYQLHTPVRCFQAVLEQPENPDSVSFTETDSFCAMQDFKDLLWNRELLKQTLLENRLFSKALCRQLEAPVADDNVLPPLLFSLPTTGESQIVYGTAFTPAGCFCIGPVRLSASIHLKFYLVAPAYPREQLPAIAFQTMDALISNLLLLHNLFAAPVSKEKLILLNCTDPQLAREDIASNFSRLLFTAQEEQIPHNPYDQELREFSSIEQGNLEMLQKSHAEDYVGKIGTLAKDELRNARNLGIVIVTLASRAAIRGGLLPEIAFSMSDVQIQKLEELSDPVAVLHLIHEFEYEYTQMVAEIKEKKKNGRKKDQNLRVNQCKDYIFQHLHDKILIQDIADSLHLNANYLSEIFHQYEGVTLTEFILQEKMNRARNLLIYSPYTYSEIAAYLGFSSQSHLGKQFKKSTGLTLRHYRELYGTRSFHTSIPSGIDPTKSKSRTRSP
ncbi:MAG: helix-turn-helix transcriptional regulator [Clostridiales bacterium]|nr:helix-turn-helix transcriptional regulator [Clostridiales bacterium]